MIEHLLTTGGPLGTLVIVVWIFVNFLGKEGDKNRSAWKEMNDQNLIARRDTERALIDNAQSTRENTTALHTSTHETAQALRAVENAVLKAGEK